MHLYKNKKTIPFPGILVTVLIFIIFLTYIYGHISDVSGGMENSDVELLQKALDNAVITCYAIEGSYPQSLEYIEEHYGIYIDESKYFVDYENDLVGMKPKISVYRIEQ